MKRIVYTSFNKKLGETVSLKVSFFNFGHFMSKNIPAHAGLQEFIRRKHLISLMQSTKKLP